MLGSAQPDALADRGACAAAGVEIVRRRSGGGAVLVAPGRQIWLDVFVPAGDPLADDDVGRASWWFGELWAACLEAVAGRSDLVAEVHRGGVAHRRGATACFAALGPGEVSVAGAKAVGISQRRNRHGAWLHSMALVGARPLEVLDYLDVAHLDAEERRAIRVELDTGVFVLDPGDEQVLESCLSHRLASFRR